SASLGRVRPLHAARYGARNVRVLCHRAWWLTLYGPAKLWASPTTYRRGGRSPQPALHLRAHGLRFEKNEVGGILAMRLAGSTMILALVLGAASAPAQESPGLIPAPTQPAAKPKPVHVAPRAKIAKSSAIAAAPKISAPATIPAKSTAAAVEPVKLDPSTEPAIPDGERVKIQSALFWSGDFTGSIGAEDPFAAAV